MSRHGTSRLPTANNQPQVSIPFHLRQKVPSRRVDQVPVTIPLRPTTAFGIVGQVKKVTADISELQKNLAVESAARNELARCVEELKIHTAEARAERSNVKRHSNGKNALTILMRKMPVKTIDDLDRLEDYAQNRSSQWTEYLRMFGGVDCSAAIKKIITTIMDKNLLKMLSWTGRQTKKPSFKDRYKEILAGIHVALKDGYKDYTIDFGETKIHQMLKNAAK